MRRRLPPRVGAAGALAVGAMVVGTLVRLLQYVGNRSLWLDEAMLVSNITDRGFGQLLKPLQNTQGAPVLFLWAERAMVVVLGNNEWALRLLPLVASIAVLPLVYVLGSRLLSPAVGAAATVLAAVSPSLVRYSTEVKQYSTDAAVALVLVLLAVRVLDGDRRALRWLVVVGAVAPWLSHPATFTLAGVGLLLLWSALRRRDSAALVPLAGTGAVWLASLAVEYVVSLRDLTDNNVLLNYWRGGFAPRPLAFGSSVRWLGSAVERFAGDPASFRFGALALVVVGAGVVALVVRGRGPGLVLLAPVPFLLVAAVARIFPFEGRVVLFLVPLFLVLVSAALALPRWPLASAAFVAVLALPQVVTTADRVVDPLPFPAARQVLRYVHDHRQPGDELWLMDPARPPYEYYATRAGVQAQRQLDWLPDEAACRAAGDRHLRPANASGRVWVVHAYTYGGEPGMTGRRIRSQLDALARRVDTHLDVDASATLYDFNALPSDSLANHIEVAPGRACLRAIDLAPVRPSGLHAGPFGTGRKT